MSTRPREDTESKSSSQRGMKGLFETALRRFTSFVHSLVLVPLASLFFTCIGLALTPAIALVQWVNDRVDTWPEIIRHLAFGASLAAGYFIYGLMMIFLIPLTCALLRAYPTEFRGPYYSFQTAKWYISNAFLYLIRYSFLEFVTPTPFNLLFYRMMGMKIGKGTQINSTHISDPAMIELGKKVTIGGSAVIVAHYGQAGYLVIASVKIGDGATIGLRATIMGDVEIGANAKILPNSVVLPKTRVPAGEVWGGVPAKKIDPKDLIQLRSA